MKKICMDDGSVMPNAGYIDLRNIVDPYEPDRMGHLTPVTGGRDIPFEIRRVYYIYGVGPGVSRGFHSHRELQQILIPLGGTIGLRLKTPFMEKELTLDDPSRGVYIGPYIWREMFDFSEHSTLLVLASEDYRESDYMRDYAEYEKEARGYFDALNGRS